MLSLLYDEHNKLHALLIALLIAATGALLQIGGGCWDVAASYIVSLQKAFSHRHIQSSLFRRHHNRLEDGAAIDYR